MQTRYSRNGTMKRHRILECVRFPLEVWTSIMDTGLQHWKDVHTLILGWRCQNTDKGLQQLPNTHVIQ